MKMKIEFEGDYYEDLSLLRKLLFVSETSGAISEARDLILNRLKHGENVSTEEENTLRQVQAFLSETLTVDYSGE